MDASKGVRKRAGIASAVAALAIVGALPTAASGDVVGDVVNSVGLGEALGTGGQQGAGNTAGSSNPHAQGTVAQVDVQAPDGVDDGGLLDNEEVVVGRSSAQQNADGSYEGGVTQIGLFGYTILGIDTDEGETVAARFQPVKDLLDSVCTGSDSSICLTLLAAESTSDGSGSSSSHAIATADIGQGENRIQAGVGESAAALADDGSCQTASASSSVARANLLGQLDGTVLESNTASASCPGSASQSGGSTVLEVNENTLPLPGDCSEGTNSGFGVLSIVEVSCNSESGSDSSGSNAAVGVDALGEDALAGTPLADATSDIPLPRALAGVPVTETAAAAQDGPDTPGGPGGDPTTGGPDAPGAPGGPGTDGPGDDTSLVSNPVGDDTVDADGKLAFTGLELPGLVGFGLALLAAGALLMGARRRLS